MIYDIDSLYLKLSAEQRTGNYFRGQVREYAGPLWPSAYRGMWRSTDSLSITDESRLRRSGTQFYFRTNAIDSQSFDSEELYNAHVDRLNRRLFIKHRLRTALGFPLSEALCQQAGITSEGLDVTKDVQVAFFFALFEWNGKEFVRKHDNGKPSIMYRWHFASDKWTLRTLNEKDYFTCPPIIPVHDLYALFDHCESAQQSAQSLNLFKKAINWEATSFDLDSVRGHRPFHLICLPRNGIEHSRITQQDAALLLPDVVTAEDFLRRHKVPSKDLLDFISDGLWVEDLAQNDSCEKFYFDTSGARNIEWLEELSPEKMFPKDETLFNLLRNWTSDFFRNPYGTMVLFLDDMDRSLDVHMRTRDDLESEFFI